MNEEGHMVNLDLKFTILERFGTQADFAVFVGEHESKVSQVLRGRRRLSQAEAKKWREVLDCTPTVIESVVEES
jgi:plasmid maintenance system antidote protein VapI